MQHNEMTRSVDLFGRKLTLSIGTADGTIVEVNGRLDDGRTFDSLMTWDHVAEQLHGNADTLPELVTSLNRKGKAAKAILRWIASPILFFTEHLANMTGGIAGYFSKPIALLILLLAGGLFVGIAMLSAVLTAVLALLAVCVAGLVIAAIAIGLLWLIEQLVLPSLKAKLFEIQAAGEELARAALSARRNKANPLAVDRDGLPDWANRT